MPVRISAAARVLGVHANTLRALEKRGIIHLERDWAGYRVFSERDLREIESRLFPKRDSDGTR